MAYKNSAKEMEYRKKYYEKHKEEIIAKQKARNDARREDVAAYRKEYYEKNKESLLEKQRVRNKLNYEEKKDEYAARSKKWAKENPERMSILAKSSREKNRQRYLDYRKEHYLNNIDKAALTARVSKMKRFGMTPAQYEEMMVDQNGVCAICGGENEVKSQFYLHIDHCHKTGKVRGLLCNKCNAMLGMARDSVEILNAAIQYLSS